MIRLSCPSTTREVLSRLKEKYNNFHVMEKIGRKWKLISDIPIEDYVDQCHREIMPDEVVWDFDVKDKEKVELYSGYLSMRLQEDNISHTMFFTGSPTGKHIHASFSELMKYGYNDRVILKGLIIEYYAKDFMDEAKIDLQTKYKHMIRCEWSIHEKHNHPKRLDYEFVSELDNYIPEVVLKQFKDIKDTPQKLYFRKKCDKYPKSIQFILSDDFMGMKDGRKRASFILASYLIGEAGKSKKETLGILREWNSYKLNKYIPDIVLINMVKGVKGSKSGRFRRDFMKSIGKEQYND